MTVVVAEDAARSRRLRYGRSDYRDRHASEKLNSTPERATKLRSVLAPGCYGH